MATKREADVTYGVRLPAELRERMRAVPLAWARIIRGAIEDALVQHELHAGPRRGNERLRGEPKATRRRAKR